MAHEYSPSAADLAKVDRANASGKQPVVFVHGMWLLDSSWDHWTALFEEAGYVAVAPTWPDDPPTVELAHEDPSVFAGKSVGDVAAYQQAIIEKLNIKPAVIENWWRQGMMGGAKAHYDGIVAFSQTDFTEDLKKISVPVLVMHGDDDQIVPYADSGPLTAKLVKNGTLKTYHGFPHGMPTTEAETINADLLAFLQS